MRSGAIKPGDVIAGKYRVRALLGRSRGTLVDAQNVDFDKRVVVRVLSPALCDARQIERFRREARILGKLQSEHVARISDFGTLPDGGFYLVREHLEGADLATHLRKSGRLALPQAAHYVLQIAEAVAETHAHNILLRELQPSHVFLAQRLGGAPTAKIIDFGTAKLMREPAAPGAGEEHTATFGMSPYSSPELVRKSKNIDARTDVWSLGAILYELLAGRPPFQGEAAALMIQITREEPTPLTSLRRELPEDIDKIIGWALAKDPEGRFPSVHGFAAELGRFAPPEAKPLIQRIAELTRAGEERRRAAQSARRGATDAPASEDADFLPDEEDGDDGEAATQIHGHASLGIDPSAARAALDGEGSPLDRTLFMGADFVPPSPAAPGAQSAFGAAGRAPGGAPSASSPGGFAHPGAPAAGAYAPPNPGGFAPQPAAPPPPAFGQPPAASTFGQPPAASTFGQPPAPPTFGQPAAAPTFGQPPPPAPSAPSFGQSSGGLLGPGPDFSRPAQPSRPVLSVPSIPISAIETGSHRAARGGTSRSVIAAIVGAAGVFVLLAVIAALTLRGSDEPAAGPEAAATEHASAPPGSATAEPVASAPQPEGSAPQPEGSAPQPAPTSVPTQVAAADPRPTPAPVGQPRPTATRPAATAAPTGGTGTLVAVAVGGTCEFSVNGASKGKSSSIRLQLKPGTYNVSCRPSTGGTKSKSVSIAEGGSAMAMFKLQ